MSIVHLGLPPLFLVISPILVRWPFPVRSRPRMRRRPRSHARAPPATHASPATHCVARWWRQFCVALALLFWSLSCTHVFYGAVIVDLFFIVILTVTLREIAAVFVMLGCCEFRNKMYKCSCWVSLFLYFCAPVFCYCFVNCKCNHRVFITHGWHTFRYDATGKIITLVSSGGISLPQWIPMF